MNFSRRLLLSLSLVMFVAQPVMAGSYRDAIKRTIFSIGTKTKKFLMLAVSPTVKITLGVVLLRTIKNDCDKAETTMLALDTDIQATTIEAQELQQKFNELSPDIAHSERHEHATTLFEALKKIERQAGHKDGFKAGHQIHDSWAPNLNKHMAFSGLTGVALICGGLRDVYKNFIAKKPSNA